MYQQYQLGSVLHTKPVQYAILPSDPDELEDQLVNYLEVGGPDEPLNLNKSSKSVKNCLKMNVLKQINTKILSQHLIRHIHNKINKKDPFVN